MDCGQRDLRSYRFVDKMSTNHVRLNSDVFFVCLTHALCTEREEVMGLLIGEIDSQNVSHVCSVIMLRRSDKRKDRVEISPEQLSAASTQAEALAEALKREIRVIGWYHSHPHITVWPSHVDVATQASYQLMEPMFVGLIFSVFEDPLKERERSGEQSRISRESGSAGQGPENNREEKQARVQVTCFQSKRSPEGGETPVYSRVEVPLHIVPVSHISSICLDPLVQLPLIFCDEEEGAYSMTTQYELDNLTKLLNSTVYTKSLCHIGQVISGPLLQALELRLINNELKLKRLQKKKEELVATLVRLQNECISS